MHPWRVGVELSTVVYHKLNDRLSRDNCRFSSFVKLSHTRAIRGFGIASSRASDRRMHSRNIAIRRPVVDSKASLSGTSPHRIDDRQKNTAGTQHDAAHECRHHKRLRVGRRLARRARRRLRNVERRIICKPCSAVHRGTVWHVSSYAVGNAVATWGRSAVGTCQHPSAQCHDRRHVPSPQPHLRRELTNAGTARTEHCGGYR